ncbi:3-hexulose-6-phosphate synthase [Microbacterium ginsengiterrae]|uniref:3-hexulose-6-phosphate synthase n=1 Tax=Microbacterium ginsengiterrae TaxID=546115 RepID=A0A7W9CAC1_9MICO|nr:3-hexulose-6-phosphate synthase [Microbacterium ginsengiterrae]MBB5741952.1 3-hexulose-6-phosphate synthase [Microbacterium ginsengiterrae]
MKLQLALDELSLEDALALMHSVSEHIDIVEIGTPFVIGRGMEAVRAFATAFPDKEVLADEKIMDGGYLETRMGIEAGASYVTALAVADNATLEQCLRAGREFGGQIVADLICVDDIASKVEELEDLGVDIVAVHTGVDRQMRGGTPLSDLRQVNAVRRNALVAVAGGIDSTSIDEYVQENPDIVIVGSGITKAEDPAREARLIKMAMLRASIPVGVPSASNQVEKD